MEEGPPEGLSNGAGGLSLLQWLVCGGCRWEHKTRFYRNLFLSLCYTHTHTHTWQLIVVPAEPSVCNNSWCCQVRAQQTCPDMWFTHGWMHSCDLPTHGTCVISIPTSSEIVFLSCVDTVGFGCLRRINSYFELAGVWDWSQLSRHLPSRLLFNCENCTNSLVLTHSSSSSSGQRVGASGDRFSGLPVGSHPHQLPAHHRRHTRPVRHDPVQAAIRHRGEFDTHAGEIQVDFKFPWALSEILFACFLSKCNDRRSVSAVRSLAGDVDDLERFHHLLLPGGRRSVQSKEIFVLRLSRKGDRGTSQRLRPSLHLLAAAQGCDFR